ncbi:MAG TPA: hypothetical protein VGK73_35405 [Polyangiaceae bacterium]
MTSEGSRVRPAFGSGIGVAFRLSTSALLLAAACLVLSGGLACAEEEFECCECFFPQCVDAMGTGAPQRVCSCAAPFTYEACGVFCEQKAPADLYNQGFTGCGSASSSLAKDSCSIGNPVGAK